MQLSGKNAVVIGGCGGIGGAIAKALLDKNVQSMAILDRVENRELIAKLSSDHPKAKIVFLSFDMGSKESIHKSLDQVAKEFKYIDILINCVGIVDETQPELVITVNLIGAILTTLKAVELMSKDKGGRGGFLVNVASVLGLIPDFTHCIFSASKHGLIGFTRSIASEVYYKHTGIKVNAFCPGKTETPLGKKYIENATLEYGLPYIANVSESKGQTTEECAATMIKALETDKNGAVWISDNAELTEVTFPTYWAPRQD